MQLVVANMDGRVQSLAYRENTCTDLFCLILQNACFWNPRCFAVGPNVGPAAMAAMPEAVHMNPVPLAASRASFSPPPGFQREGFPVSFQFPFPYHVDMACQVNALQAQGFVLGSLHKRPSTPSNLRIVPNHQNNLSQKEVFLWTPAQDPNEVRLQREVLDRNQLLRFTSDTRKREKSRVVANLWSQGLEFLEALRIVDEAFQDS